MAQIQITQTIDLGRVADMLCNALEGGSNYWYEITDKVEPRIWSLDERPNTKNPDVHYLHYYPLNEGGALLITDGAADEPDLNEETAVRLDLDAIKMGLQIMANKYPSHFGDFKNDNDDANTADVFLQCCVWGEVVFG